MIGVLEVALSFGGIQYEYCRSGRGRRVDDVPSTFVDDIHGDTDAEHVRALLEHGTGMRGEIDGMEGEEYDVVRDPLYI